MKRKINRIALINAPIDIKYKDSTSIFCPPIGLMSIKTYIERNDEFEVILLDGMVLTQNEIIRKMHTFHPDIVGVSIQLISYKNALQICREANQHGAFVLVGGHHATQMAKKIIHKRNSYIDCIVCGDGEKPIYQLCLGIKPEEIPGIVCWDHYRNKAHTTKQLICNLDDLPNPYLAKNIDYSPYISNYKKSKFSCGTQRYYRVYSHKGCKFRANGEKCIFCGRADEGYRFFSINRYFANLVEMGVDENDYVFDVGDDLCGNIEWLQGAARYIQENTVIRPQIGIFGRGDEITLDSAILLKKLGVVDVTMGVETGDSTVLRSSGKGINGSDVFYKSAKMLFYNGIGITPSYVLGLPGENSRSLYSTINHARGLLELSESILGYSPREIVANLIEPIPGSSAYRLLEKEIPHKYMFEDDLELEAMQRDYFCTVFSMNLTQYDRFREEIRSAGRIINHLAPFSDPQGWLRDEV